MKVGAKVSVLQILDMQREVCFELFIVDEDGEPVTRDLELEVPPGKKLLIQVPLASLISMGADMARECPAHIVKIEEMSSD